MTQRLWRAIAAGSILLLACKNDASGPSEPYASLVDPFGDTFGPGTGGITPDIVSLSGRRDRTNFIIEIRFADPIAPSTSTSSFAVAGFVDLDVDQDLLTGGRAATDVYRPASSGSSALGIEYFVSLFLTPSGAANISEGSSGSPLSTVEPTYSGQTITLTIPLSQLGNDDGEINVGAVMGTRSFATDLAPNDGHLMVGGGGRSTNRRIASPRVSATTRVPAGLQWPSSR